MAGGPAAGFSAIARSAQQLLEQGALEGAPVDALMIAAEALARMVPKARFADWKALVYGFRKHEDASRRRARLEGLVRACALFSETGAPPLATSAPRAVSVLPTDKPRRASRALELDGSIEALDGLGAAAARTLAELGVRNVGDLLLSLPIDAVDLRAPLSGKALLDAVTARPRSVVAIRGVVERSSVVPMRGRRAIRVAMRSDGVLVELWWFFMSAAARGLTGETIAVGRPTPDARRLGVLRVAHPRLVPIARLGAMEPIYPFKGVPSTRIAHALATALPRLDVASIDPLPSAIATARKAAAFASVLEDVHAPTTPERHALGRERLRARLAWAEAAWMVGKRLERERATEGLRSPRLARDEVSSAALISALGFTLTAAQTRAIEAISARIDRDTPTRTLLTGDVGTGKTAVLLAAAAQAITSRVQVAILAPTTILAEQYLDAAGPLARGIGARIALLPRNAGVDRPAHARVSAAVRRGDVDVVIGTHALLGEGVCFARLGLAIVDEQHRLGVAQRLHLVTKSDDAIPHLLTVSATPIPRTLALVLRGEIATVHLDERPRGRSTPSTRLAPRRTWDAIVSCIRARMDAGEATFVVCATIEPSLFEDGTPDDAASPGAVARAKQLGKQLGSDAVALVHGGLDDATRRRAIASFRTGEARVLVGTSMLEVGLDVPEATLMVIDGADRFGLAQLHQLRGRVGRGDRAGECVLVHGEPLSELAAARLHALVEADDGLAVARADLRLRGPGDLEGARQSGEAAGLRYLDPTFDEAILVAAAADIAAILSRDPHLDAPEHSGLRRALLRFDADAEARELGLARGEAG